MWYLGILTVGAPSTRIRVDPKGTVEVVLVEQPLHVACPVLAACCFFLLGFDRC